MLALRVLISNVKMHRVRNTEQSFGSIHTTAAMKCILRSLPLMMGTELCGIRTLIQTILTLVLPVSGLIIPVRRSHHGRYYQWYTGPRCDRMRWSWQAPVAIASSIASQTSHYSVAVASDGILILSGTDRIRTMPFSQCY